jgi:hypothetical protein
MLLRLRSALGRDLEDGEIEGLRADLDHSIDMARWAGEPLPDPHHGNPRRRQQ